MKTFIYTGQKEATNVRIPSDLKARLLQVSKRNHMSLSDAVRLSIITFIPEMESGEFRLKGLNKGQS
jgi:predicted DNA-binding protein